MAIKRLVPTMTEQWKTVYEKERPNLVPNAITGEALAEYVQTQFAATPITEEAYLDAIRTDVRNSAFFAEKLHGAEPDPAAFRLPDGTFVGIDRVSGWFIAENDRIRDELTYVKGLDEADLANILRTVDWLRCKKTVEAERKSSNLSLLKKAFRDRRNAERQEEKQ